MKVNVIYPYKYYNKWVFDDPSTKLVKEPFVLGSSEILDYVVDDPSVRQIEVLFSDDEETFQGHETFHLVKLFEENGGCWYEEESSGMEGWLCPQLYKYFDKAPIAIYVKVNHVE